MMVLLILDNYKADSILQLNRLYTNCINNLGGSISETL